MKTSPSSPTLRDRTIQTASAIVNRGRQGATPLFTLRHSYGDHVIFTLSRSHTHTQTIQSSMSLAIVHRMVCGCVRVCGCGCVCLARLRHPVKGTIRTM